jgi:hypothetical protein
MAAFCMCTGEKTMTQRTLADLKEALQHPFAPETIQFLPKEIHQENGNSVCLALPYANKRIYEDRLNALVFGEWSTPYTEPYAQGNKLIIPATVIILGVAHTDYGEAYFTTTGKNGTTREDDNTATEAYSQAFRRACAKFFLGRYLYDLPKLTLPYDPKTHQIAISKAERIAWVEKLYQKQGVLPKVHTATAKPAAGASSSTQTTKEPATTPATPAVQHQAVKTSPTHQSLSTQAATPASAPQQKGSSVGKESQSAPQQLTRYPNDTFLDWVAASVGRDSERIQGICTFYGVPGLAKLSAQQRTALTKRLRQQTTQKQAPASSAVATPSV